MDKLTSEDERKFINKLTQVQLQEVLSEAHFHQISTREWLNSPWSAEFIRRVMEQD